MKKLIAAIIVSVSMLANPVMAAETCHTVKELIDRVKQETDVKFKTIALNDADSAKFIKNASEVFNIQADGAVHVYVMMASGIDDSVFIVFTDKSGCITSGGAMDNDTLQEMLQ